MNIAQIKPHHISSDPRRLVMRYERDASLQAFAGSLQLILQAILRDQAGDAVCLYELIEPGVLVLRERIGAPLARLETANLQLSEPASAWLRNLHVIEAIDDARNDLRVSDFPEVLLHQFTSIAVAPIRRDDVLLGIATLSWTSGARRIATDRLQPLLDCAAALLNRGGQTSAALRLIAEIANLESDLANLKIAERAAGVVNGADWTDHAPFVLQQHISRVLEGTDITRELKGQLAALQSRLHDRQVLATAKARLQDTLELDEESAYLFLRNASRRARRPLREIAQDILTGAINLQRTMNAQAAAPQRTTVVAAGPRRF